MSSFRRYGGLNFSANNNITRSYISNSEQMNINNYSGQQNSKEVFASHIDMSGNSMLHTGSIYFQDGTSISTAGNIGAQGATGAQGNNFWSPTTTGPTGIFYLNGGVAIGGTTITNGYVLDVTGQTILKNNLFMGGASASNRRINACTYQIQSLDNLAIQTGTIYSDNSTTITYGNGITGGNHVFTTVDSTTAALRINSTNITNTVSDSVIIQPLMMQFGTDSIIGQLKFNNFGGVSAGIQSCINFDNSGIPNNTDLRFFTQLDYTNYLERMRIDRSGLVFINYRLTVAGGMTLDEFGNMSLGTINATGAITALSFTATSDYRAKEDIKPLNLEEYSVDNLNPVHFKFKNSGKESIGLIAHELQEYYPFLVEGEKDGEQKQSVNYNGLIGVLIKEIQELKKDLNNTKCLVDQLRNQLNGLN